MPQHATVLIGPARCGKTNFLLRKFQEHLQQPGRLAGGTMWLAPTARAAADVRQRLLDGVPACLDPGVVTFTSFADRVLASADTPPRPITPLEERTILRKVVARALENDALKYLSGAARRFSFADDLRDHLQELKRRGVGPVEFARTPLPGRERQQHDELAVLFRDYETQLAAHRICDEEGRQLAVGDALRADTKLNAGLELVVVDGFTDFTQPQLSILDLLARRSGQLFVSLPGDDELDFSSNSAWKADSLSGRGELFAKTAATIAELRLRQPSLELQRLPCRDTGWPALDQISQSLFKHPRDIPPMSLAAQTSLDRLEIVAAASVQDEIVDLARSIKTTLTSGDPVNPSDILVVLRNLRGTAPRIRAVFEEYGIPYSLEAGLPLAATGIVKTLLALLRLEAEDWPFRRVVAVVTNNMLTAERHERAAAERLVRDLQIAAGKDELLARAQSLCGGAPTTDLDPPSNPQVSSPRNRRSETATAALPFLQRIAAAIDALPNEATPGDWIAALGVFGQQLGIAAFASTGTLTNDDRENIAAWQQVASHIASLDRLARWLGEPAPILSRVALLELLVDIASHESLRRPFDDTGRVRVLSAKTARTVNAKYVYLAGMSERTFPSPERAGRLYSETDYRFFANAANQERAAAELPETSRAQEEMLLFYEVLTRASKRLTISYPAMDQKAQSLPASPYVTEIERSVEPHKIRHLQPSKPSPLPPAESPLSMADWRIAAMHEAVNRDGSLALLAGLFADPASKTVAASLEAALRIAHSRSRREGFGPAEGMLESAAVQARLANRFGREHFWSPSQLEKFAACPYSFFMSQVLGLEPLGEIGLDTNYLRRGSLVHHTLAEFHRQLPVLLGVVPRLSHHEAGQFIAALNNVLETLVQATPAAGVDAGLIELDRRQIAKWANQYHAEHVKYDANKDWSSIEEPPTPAYLEWRFGPARSDQGDYEDPNSTADPLVIKFNGEEIRVAGRIDRIDVGRAAGRLVYNVIDYKSGDATGLRETDLTTGQRLQPALYVMAAQALLFRGDDAVPIFAGYWSLAKGVKLGRSLRFGKVLPAGPQPTDEWPGQQQTVVELIANFVERIRQGEFPVSSRDEHCTSRCEFATVCRVGQVRNLGKTCFDEVPVGENDESAD